MGTIEVIEAGMLSSVQDLGRTGYGAFGVPMSGAFDSVALRLGNRLLGNAESNAGIELTMLGGAFQFSSASMVCLTGARAERAVIVCDGHAQRLAHGIPTAIAAGSLLRIGPLSGGVRGYLCIAGGIQSPELLGSRSALVSLPNAGLGQQLMPGDRLKFIVHDSSIPGMPRSVSSPCEPQTKVLRIVPSMHTARFRESQLKDLCAQPFSVSDDSNRAGVRLTGRSLRGTIPGRVASVGTLPGYVQVPSSGEPIVLGVDGPTTGGYPVIGCVIEADLPVLAQCGPREEVCFAWTRLEAARRALIDQEAMIQATTAPVRVAARQSVLLGCDTGEAESGAGRKQELELLPYVNAVSIACGGHAGNDESMRHAIASAAGFGCVVGAHPSYPDRVGFGRRSVSIDRATLARSLAGQLEAFARHAEEHGVAVSYIKAHGALYHDVAQNVEFAHWYWARCALVFPGARFVGALGSPALAALKESGVPTLTEGFCDRVYEPDGGLRSRSAMDAMIEDAAQAVSQAERLICEHGCDLLCVHSDTPDALGIARAVSARLHAMGMR
ncbi:MAG: 5-oxoprolinase/urea amidolyase family protein [Phycisphaerales bacterium JB047]